MKSFSVTVCGSAKLMGFVEQSGRNGDLLLLEFHNVHCTYGWLGLADTNIFIYTYILNSTMIIMKSWMCCDCFTPAYTKKFISQAIWHRKINN